MPEEYTTGTGFRSGSSSSTPRGDGGSITEWVTEEVRHKVAGIIDERKKTFADRLKAIAGVIRDLGSRTGGGDSPVSRYADTAANRLEQLTDRLRTADVDELARETKQVVSRNPMLLFGAGLAIGIAATMWYRGGGMRRAAPGGSGNAGLLPPSQSRSGLQ